jgi:hypothetical protein
MNWIRISIEQLSIQLRASPPVPLFRGPPRVSQPKRVKIREHLCVTRCGVHRHSNHMPSARLQIDTDIDSIWKQGFNIIQLKCAIAIALTECEIEFPQKQLGSAVSKLYTVNHIVSCQLT